MLSVKIFTSSKAAAKYYSHGDYYGSEGEGAWFGRGTKDLGLIGNFTAKENKQFTNLLGGILPNGQDLARKTKDGREHNPGTDLTFSVPKSFSIQMMLYATSEERQAMEKAVISSVNKTLSYIEKEGYIFARKGSNGKQREKLTSLTFATFLHTTNRNLEPQVHIHSFLANVAKCSDSKYRCVNIDNLLKNNKFFGQIFRNELAIETKQLGLDITSTILADGSGSFELSKIHPKLIEAFSTRRKEIVELCKLYGITSKAGRDKVVINSRKTKKLVTQEELSKAWREIEQQVQKEIDSSSIGGSDSIEEMASTSLNIKDLVKLCVGDISYNKTVFTKEEIIQKTLRYGIGNFTIEDCKKEIAALIQNGDLIQHQDKYTTKELLFKEKQIWGYAINAINHGKAMIQAKKFEVKLQQFQARAIAKDSNFQMNDQQKLAIKHILTSNDQTITMEGLPGVGKSTVLNAVREISKRKIINMLGLGDKFKGSAPTASASKTLSESAGVESQTLHSFIAKYRGYIEGRGSTSLSRFKREYKNTIVFLDEASLVSTTVMHQLLTLQDKFGFRLVLTGDTKQLGSVEAGKPFEQILDIIKPVKLQEIVRQKDQTHRQAVIAASTGQISQSFSIHHDSIKTSNSLANDAVRAYLSKSIKEQDNTLLISPTRALRDEINHEIVAAKLNPTVPVYNFTTLRPKNMTKADYNFAASFKAGDVIRFNVAYQNGINKGDYLTVKSIHPSSSSMVLDKNGKDIFLSLRMNTDYSQKMQVFENHNLQLQEGLKIIFTKNNREHKLINSETAIVQKITPNHSLNLRLEDGTIKTIPLAQLKHIDYGYCVTIHSAQGKTFDHTIVAINNNKLLNHQKMWLVALSRHRTGFTALVEDKNVLQNNIISNKAIQKSALELRNSIINGSISE